MSESAEMTAKRLAEQNARLERHAEKKGVREDGPGGYLLAFLDGDCQHPYRNGLACDLCGDIGGARPTDVKDGRHECG